MSQTYNPEQLSPPAVVMQMITGHWVSQLVGSLCRLGIPDALAEQPMTSAAIAQKCGSNLDATYRILRAATSLGLFKEVRPDTYQLTPLGDVLKSDTPGSLRDFSIAETDHGHWMAWGSLIDAVKTGEHAAPKALGKEIFEWYEEHPREADIIEMVPDDNSPSFASLMDLNMMVMLPGRERTLKEYSSLLDRSGLKFERLLPTHSPFQIIEASKKWSWAP